MPLNMMIAYSAQVEIWDEGIFSLFFFYILTKFTAITFLYIKQFLLTISINLKH